MGGVLGIMLANKTVTGVAATGGNYIYDGTGAYTGYRFHVFTSPGTFTVTSNQDGKTFDAIIVGGGGGAGSAGAIGDGGGGAGGGAVTEVTGLSLTTNTGYAATVGAGGGQGPAPNPVSTAGSASSWNGYSAAGGGRGTGPFIGTGISGNGNAGGTLVQGAAHTGPRLGNGGGGAGGVGIPFRGWGPVTATPPAYPVYAPYFNTYSYPTPHLTYFATPNAGNYAGGGGPGITSSIDGIKYGGGGGGGVVRDTGGAYPSAYWNGKYTPETDPTGASFNDAGGGLAFSPGSNGKGGGGGGQPGGPPAYNNQFTSGGSGTVVIRYPYP